MKPLRFILILSLLQSASIANAQDFKVIKDTTDYILKEVDSVYYYSHGIGFKHDGILHSDRTYREKDMMKLPLDNGKFCILKDKKDSKYKRINRFEYCGYNNLIEKYIVSLNGDIYYLINKHNGIIDTLGNDEPWFSPNSKFYGYMSVCGYLIKNLTTNKIFCIDLKDQIINLGHSSPTFKWIDDYSILYSTSSYNYQNHVINFNIYYLVQIKK